MSSFEDQYRSTIMMTAKADLRAAKSRELAAEVELEFSQLKLEMLRDEKVEAWGLSKA